MGYKKASLGLFLRHRELQNIPSPFLCPRGRGDVSRNPLLSIFMIEALPLWECKCYRDPKMPLLEQLGLPHFFIYFPFTGEEGDGGRQGRVTPLVPQLMLCLGGCLPALRMGPGTCLSMLQMSPLW